MMHRSEDASLRPSTSRIALGDITATIGGNSHFGPNAIRVIGPPATRITCYPASSLRTSFTSCRIGRGFFGANGNELMSIASVVVGFTSRSR